MTIAAAALILLPCLQQNASDQEADQLLGQFEKLYNSPSSREDEGVREGALTLLRGRQHPKILAALVKVGNLERSLKIKAVVAQSLGEYRESEKAAETLASWLDKKGLKDPVYVLNQRCLESLGSLNSKVSRKHVEKVNEFIGHREGGVAKSAVMATGSIRHKDSIEPLLDEMKRCQREMLAYITAEKIDGCDGG